MPIHREFAYYAARLLLRNEPDPFSEWRLAPLLIPGESLAANAIYNPEWEAFEPKAIGAWSIQPYVAPGVPDPPPDEVLPFAWLTNSPTPWLNDTDAAIIVASLAVTALDSAFTEPARTLLFWQGLDAPVTVESGETFEVTKYLFEIVELADL